MRYLRIRRLALVAAGAALLLAAASSAAVNFKAGPTFTINDQGQLVCSADVSGLGNASSTPATCSSSSASATYQCINNGGKNPAAGNKTTVTEPVSATEPVDVRNGRAHPVVEAGPPGPGSFSCPSGQTLFLTAVTYTNPTFTIQGETRTGDTISRDDLRVRA